MLTGGFTGVEEQVDSAANPTPLGAAAGGFDADRETPPAGAGDRVPEPCDDVVGGEDRGGGRHLRWIGKLCGAGPGTV